MRRSFPLPTWAGFGFLVLVVVGIVAFAVATADDPLGTPEEVAVAVAGAAERSGEHEGVTATCHDVTSDDDRFVRCRLRDADGRHGWSETRITRSTSTEHRVLGGVPYRTTTDRADGTRTDWDFPVGPDGVAEVEFSAPSENLLGAALLSVARPALLSVGLDTGHLPRRCPPDPVPVGGTASCPGDTSSVAVEVTRDSDAGYRARITLPVG
ncbi:MULTISPECIES: hypothetical protein [Pseudonocardia]|nr:MULTISPECIES: hypothetical protein [Pseudonocardia]